MNELRLIFLAYVQMAVEWSRKRLNIKVKETYISPKNFFKKGDFVEAKDGSKGHIWRVYIKIKTGEPVGCSVMWDSTYNGDKITPFLSAEDKSPQFNPDIRKLVE